MTAILPEEEQEELPTGFTIVGHVGIKPATLPITVPQSHHLTFNSAPQPPRKLPPLQTPHCHCPPGQKPHHPHRNQ